ncbi:MAG: protein-glutamate O-methyltransferase CheR, partial [Myxococcales bacterium]|nr:protein-glutamate O-methyltransferase CheR [Myxococcales bacterium]
TTNETSFFRDAHVFVTLAENKLPGLLPTRRDRSLRVWSAACSTGQEPYSLGILLLEHPELRGWDVSIRATDLCSTVLAKAESGLYRAHEIQRGLSDAQRERWFEPSGRHWAVRRRLRELVSFATWNLLDPNPPAGPFDLVFLRNVLIYFDAPTQQRVLRSIHRSMAPGALLVLGGTEAATRVPAGCFDVEREERSTWLRRR